MNWAELPSRLKAFIVLVACLALPIFVWSGWELLTTKYNNHGYIWLALLALFTIPLSHLFPSFNATITIGDTYIMAMAMMYGTAPCVVATGFYILLISL